MALGSPLPARTLSLAILVVTISTLPVFLLGAGAVTIGDELGFGPRGLGVLTAVFFLTSSLLSARAGRIVEKTGWERVMRRNILGSALLLLVTAAGVRSLWSFAAILFLAGLAYAFGNPAANMALADAVVPAMRGRAFALKHAGIPLSGFIAGLAVPTFVTTIGWQWAYLAASGLAAMVALAVPTTVEAATATTRESHGKVGRRQGLRMLGAGAMLATAAPVALASFGVSAAVDAGIGMSSAGLLLSLGSLVSISARITYGIIVDRKDGNGLREMARLLVVGASVFGVLTVTSGAVFAVAMLIAFGTAWAWPGLMTYAVVRAYPDAAASTTGVVQGGLFIGAGVGPIVMGLIAESFGFGAAMAVVAAALLGGAGMVSVVERTPRWRAASQST